MKGLVTRILNKSYSDFKPNKLPGDSCSCAFPWDCISMHPLCTPGPGSTWLCQVLPSTLCWYPNRNYQIRCSGHSCVSTALFSSFTKSSHLYSSHRLPTSPSPHFQSCIFPPLSAERWTRIWSRRMIYPSFLKIWFSLGLLTNLYFLPTPLFFSF